MYSQPHPYLSVSFGVLPTVLSVGTLFLFWGGGEGRVGQNKVSLCSPDGPEIRSVDQAGLKPEVRLPLCREQQD